MRHKYIPEKFQPYAERILPDSITTKQKISVFSVFFIAVFLRLRNLPTWFNRVHDYDEGAWVLAARLIGQGKSLYTDVFFVHPPLYEYVLAGLYAITGYDFLYARYLSVVFSLLGLAAIGYVAYELFHIEAAIIALALSAFNPINVYISRRAVQEPLAILFLSLAIVALLPLIRGEDARLRRYGLAGIALGLMTATKFVFLPAVLGVGVGALAILVLSVFESDTESLSAAKSFATLVVSTIIGFLLVTAHLWLTIPETFLEQTVLIHIGRDGTGSFPSFLSAIENYQRNSSWLSWYYLPMLATFPAILLILARPIYNIWNGDEYSTQNLFMGCGLLAAFLLAQFLSYLPRYYIALYPFMTLGLAGQIPRDIWTSLRQGTVSKRMKILVISVLLCGFLVLSLPIPYVFHGYDVTWQIAPNGETDAYEQTTDYLESQNANVVYSSNPTLTALTDDVTTINEYESFAHLYMRDQQPEEYAKQILSKNPDYIVLDPWLRSWAGDWQASNDQFMATIRENSELVKAVPMGDGGYIGIYEPSNESTNVIFNGDLHTVNGENAIGWRTLTNVRGGDSASLSAQDNSLEIALSQDGVAETESGWAHAETAQLIRFPEEPIPMCVKTSTNSSLGEPRSVEAGASVTHDGNRLMFALSQEAEDTTVVDGDGWRYVVLPAESGYHTQTLNISEYWNESWEEPDRVSLAIYVAAHAEKPGKHSLSVKSVGTACS
ncbi:ArnT family glycosyltransferase [Natrinema sp. CGMCC1.2065]|uniref:ArnT family glycosyltransferase n=1 Tax=Natrinema sp. CGMCC1.2065 TaxID=3445767 RepID=UPI003F4A3B4E